jgi:hypothetical protein
MTFGIANAVLMQQTGFVKATLAQGLTLTVDWGARSQALQAKLSTASGPSFLIASPGGSPVTIGLVADADLPSWDTATTTSVAVTRKGTDTKVKATFPPLVGPAANHLNVRLDFSLTVTAGGQSAVVLSFSQLLLLDSSNALTAQQCAIDNTFLTPGANGPVKGSPAGAPAPPVHRTFPGAHALVTISQAPGPAVGTTATVFVNAEFVDLTLLWWALRKDGLNWYLNPDLPKPGRQANLRVLGWSGGGNPMLWFAVIPDAAALSIGAGTEDLVFLRPQAGINSFAYPPTAAGLADTRHDSSSPVAGTLYVLGRYLLSPIPADQLATVAAKKSVQQIELMADQVQLSSGTAVTAPSPTDPMTIATGFPGSFRPVGMEGAFNSAGGSRVLLLPLAAGDTAAPYEGATIAGLKATSHSAVATLWSAGAVDTSGTAVPSLDAREIWLGGHSGGNMSMWQSAQNNKADISRIITFDASPWSGNLQGGIGVLGQVNKARTGAGKSLDVFAIVSPNLSQGKKGITPAGKPFLGLDDDTDLQLRKTGASITVLPDFSRRESFWNPLPAPAVGSPKTFVQYLLSQWTDAGTTINAVTPPAPPATTPPTPPPDWIGTSAGTPSTWRFLFFHETAMDGGDLVAGATPTSSPTVKTFFEQALGAPSPRPPP